VIHPAVILLVASLLGAAAIAMLLPGRRGAAARRRRIALGAVPGISGLGLLVSQLPGVGDWSTGLAFYLLSGVTLVAAVATISSRKPVYSAIWFGLVLLGTSGLFLVQGAQFLAVATIVVYAGAILVTFLFVLMLAVPEGRAGCDRTSHEGLVSAVVAAVMVGVLTVAIDSHFDQKPDATWADAPAQSRAEGVLGPGHVARFGAELFGRHLIAVEVAGMLLLAALVGAAAIAGTSRTRENNEKEPQMNTDEHG